MLGTTEIKKLQKETLDAMQFFHSEFAHVHKTKIRSM